MMKKGRLKINTIFYSKRFECFGQCLNIRDYMAYMIWAKPSAPAGWYHCEELVYDVGEINK